MALMVYSCRGPAILATVEVCEVMHSFIVLPASDLCEDWDSLSLQLRG